MKSNSHKVATKGKENSNVLPSSSNKFNKKQLEKKKGKHRQVMGSGSIGANSSKIIVSPITTKEEKLEKT